MKKSLNDIAKYEVAISKKYGKDAIKHPQADWNDEQEKKTEKVEVDGFLISKKLFTKDSNRICPTCHSYSFDLRDDVYMTKFDCCFKCYIQWVEGREERWKSGWRPKEEK
jgi:hypothetical protein